MKSPHSLTDEQLTKYADEHIQYEYDMLIWSAGVEVTLARYNREGHLAWAIHNGILNTFAIHARNLIDFLYPGSLGKGLPTDVMLGDYLSPDAIAKYLPPIPPILAEANVKANKQVAHLTLERIQYETAGKEWKFVEVAGEIVKALSKVAPHIPQSKISSELKAKLSQPNLVIPLVGVSLVCEAGNSPTGVMFTLYSQRA